MAVMAREKNTSSAVMVGGYYVEGATDFYTTAERRGTSLKKGINTNLSEAKTLLQGGFYK